MGRLALEATGALMKVIKLISKNFLKKILFTCASYGVSEERYGGKEE